MHRCILAGQFAEAGNCILVLARNKMRPAKMAPISFRMIGVERHRLLDPVNTFQRAAGPGQQFALLHHDQIVIGIQLQGPLLVSPRQIEVVSRDTDGR